MHGPRPASPWLSASNARGATVPGEQHACPPSSPATRVPRLRSFVASVDALAHRLHLARGAGEQLIVGNHLHTHQSCAVLLKAIAPMVIVTLIWGELGQIPYEPVLRGPNRSPALACRKGTTHRTGGSCRLRLS